jgi:hypothetical protein
MNTSYSKPIPKPIRYALQRILDRSWREDEQSFLKSSDNREAHIFWDMVHVRRWLRNPSGEPDSLGGCPIARTDSTMAFSISEVAFGLSAIFIGSNGVSEHSDWDWWVSESEAEWEENRLELHNFEEVEPDLSKFRDQLLPLVQNRL